MRDNSQLRQHLSIVRLKVTMATLAVRRSRTASSVGQNGVTTVTAGESQLVEDQQTASLGRDRYLLPKMPLTGEVCPTYVTTIPRASTRRGQAESAQWWSFMDGINSTNEVR